MIDWLIEDTGVYNLQINNNITSIGSDQKITVIWLTVDIKIILELHSCEEKMQKIQNRRKNSNKKILFFFKKKLFVFFKIPRNKYKIWCVSEVGLADVNAAELT